MSQNNFLDDLAKFGGSALNEMDNVQRQLRRWAGEQVDYAVESMDIVTEEKFNEQAKVIAALSKKVDELEKKLAKLDKGGSAAVTKKPVAKKKAPAKKPAAKKAATKAKPKAKTAKKA